MVRFCHGEKTRGAIGRTSISGIYEYRYPNVDSTSSRFITHIKSYDTSYIHISYHVLQGCPKRLSSPSVRAI